MDLNEKVEEYNAGRFVKNKTYEYLFPFLKTYKYKLYDKITGLKWLAVGIGDFFYDKKLQSRLFILVNIIDGAKFQAFLDWFRENQYHVDDYPFSDIKFKDGSDLHMIVVEYTDEKTFNHFINSKFSAMYAGKNISKFIKRIIPILPDGGGAIRAEINPVYQVITRDDKYKELFIDKIREQYGTELTLTDLADGRELELPINKDKEIFNHG
jgi:hypothetical protein